MSRIIHKSDLPGYVIPLDQQHHLSNLPPKAHIVTHRGEQFVVMPWDEWRSQNANRVWKWAVLTLLSLGGCGLGFAACAAATKPAPPPAPIYVMPQPNVNDQCRWMCFGGGQ